MNRLLLLMATVLITSNPCLAAGQAATNQPADVAIIAIGDVPEKLAGHARGWVQHNLAIKVGLLPPEKLQGRNLDEIADQAARAGGKGCKHVVAIALPPEGINNHGMRTADKRAAVVNLRPMQEDKPDEQTLERRIERQTIRAISLMLDVPTCVNPQCALSHYQSLKELDASGRNLCPPCLQKLMKGAADEHLHMDTESPFYIGN